jgi:DNA-binding NtrC family response regulator
VKREIRFTLHEQRFTRYGKEVYMVKNAESEMSNLKSKISKPNPLMVLMVEDSEDDALLVLRALKKGGYEPEYERVETSAAMRKALQDKTWDVILCDYQLPGFNGIEAIALLQRMEIDIPIIIVSGVIGEDKAVECMRFGAHDYIMKSHLARLAAAVARELEDRKTREKMKVGEVKLQESEQRFKALFENMSRVQQRCGKSGTCE